MNGGAALFALLLGMLLTLGVSPVVVVLFRRAVRRVMMAGRGSHTTQPPAAARHTRAPLTLETVDRPASSPLDDRSRRLRRAALGVHLLSGSALLLVLALLYALTARPDDWNAVILAKLFAAFCTALIPVIATVGAGARRFRLLLIPALIAAVVTIVAIQGRQSIAMLILIAVLPPILFLLLVANRRLKTTAPMLLIVTIAFAIGFESAPFLAYRFRIFSLLWIVKAAAIVAGIAALRVVVAAYDAKKTGDQLLLIDVYWLLVCVFHLILELENSAYWWLAIIAFVAYKGVQLALMPYVVHMVRSGPRVQLLLLRAFGSQSRSEELIEEIGIRWRYLGPIHIICGTDVATADLDPPELWQFLKWRTHDLSVRDELDLDRRLADRKLLRPDPDGRYRVNDFFCRDDTWRATVVRLMERSDAVLLDVRGFRAANKGVIFELRRLLADKPLASIVLVTDDTTIEQDLRAVIDEAWQSVDATSINATSRDPRLRIVRLHGRRLDAARVVRALCNAAATTPHPSAVRCLQPAV